MEAALPVSALLACVFASLLAGIPVAFALAGSALACALLGSLTGTFDLFLLNAIPSRIFGTAMFNEVLTAVPLFILMGVMLERSRLAEDLLSTMAALFSRLPAGLGVAVTIVGTLVAASTGIVGATVVAMALIALPVMLKRGYDPAFSAGSICAAGTLGQIIPPSIVLVFLADQLSAAYQQAQRAAGHFAPEPVSIGDLFAGALVPGLLLAVLYALYQVIAARLKPDLAPPVTSSEAPGWKRVVGSMVVPLALMASVLGSIVAGIATPTEAAGVGAFGAMLLAARRVASGGPTLQRILIDAGLISLALLVVIGAATNLRNVATASDMALFALACIAAAGLALAALVSLHALHRAGLLFAIASSAARFSALAFTILIGATIFTLVFRGFGGDAVVRDLLDALPGGTMGAVVFVSLAIFALGFVLDFIEIVFIVLPVVAPAILAGDVDPVWFGVLVALNLQTSFLTPPFGFALFYFRGAAGDQVRTAAIYRGVVPFIVIQLIVLLLVAFVPQIATWLPALLRG